MKIIKPNTNGNSTRSTKAVRIGNSNVNKSNRNSCKVTGTSKFIAVDGEGINVVNNDHLDSANCFTCGNDLTSITRYRINEEGPYCRECYFDIQSKAVQSLPPELANKNVEYIPRIDNHEYVLFGVGNDQIENPRGLIWHEIFEFVYAKYERYTGYCGFFLRYDFNCILRTMPENRVWRLVTKKGIDARKSTSKNYHGRTLPVDMSNGWQIDMLGMRFMKIRKRACHCDLDSCGCDGKQPWMYICDTGPFFQTSLLNVIKPSKWDRDPETKAVLDDLYPLIEEGKKDRSVASKIDAKMRKYNRAENEALSVVLQCLNKGFNQMDIVMTPQDWHGSGITSGKWLKKQHAPDKEKMMLSSSPAFIQAAHDSYIAGWFELMMHGIIPGNTYTYDINSAYPYIIRNLPCLEHGEYSNGYGKPPTTSYPQTTFIYARVQSNMTSKRMPDKYVKMRVEPTPIGCMLHRDKNGHIFRPTRTEGWFLLSEVLASQDAGLIDEIEYKEWQMYIPCDCPSPFAAIADLYSLRTSKDVGKESPLGKACKLVINSVYGKLAQSVGNPRYANPYYATAITSGCRKMITEAIGTKTMGSFIGNAWNVVMVNTDSVTFMDEHEGLTLTSQLGAWELDTIDNLTIAGLGIYWTQKTIDLATQTDYDDIKFKSRGFSAKAFAKNILDIQGIFKIWGFIEPESPGKYGRTDKTPLENWPRLEFKSGFAMTSALQSIIQNDWSHAGFVDNDRKVLFNSNPSMKRQTISPFRGLDGRVIWKSLPWDLPIDDCVCKPYEKKFGIEDPWGEENIDAFGINQEGLVADGFKEFIGIDNND